jgi:hypothetical protein
MTYGPTDPNEQWRRTAPGRRQAGAPPPYPATPPPRPQRPYPRQDSAGPNVHGHGYATPPPVQSGPAYGPQYQAYQYSPLPGYGAPGFRPVPPQYPPPNSSVGQQPSGSRIRQLLNRKGAKAIAGAMATVLVTTLGVVGTYVLAPSQEVASQEAIEQHQRDQDAQTAPVTVEDVWGASTPDGEPNLVSNSVVDLDGKVLQKTETDHYGGASLLPSPFPMGNVLFSSSGEFISGSKSSVGFTLTGQQNATVRIRDIQAVVTQRNPAFKGTMIFFPPQGNLENLQMGFDLDSDDLSARVLDEEENVTSNHYFRENTVSLERGEPIGFNTIATTTDCACKFILRVEFSEGRIKEINNNGDPFMLAPYRDDAQSIYTPTSSPDKSGDWMLTRCSSMAACAQIAYQ